MPDLLSGSIVRGVDTPPSASDRQGTAVTGITSTTYEAQTSGSALCGQAFTAPTTGRVRVDWAAELDNSTTGTTWLSFRVRAGATVGSGTQFQAPSDDMSLFAAGTNNKRAAMFDKVDGLTPGQVYNVTLEHRVNSGTGTVGRRFVMIGPTS